ncbi:MAG: ABC transporter substrate-binding protein [Bacteroidales bacterium]|nr:ABC transporter substrate-binding protein [Bacteroidales bacterium]
MRFLYLVIVTVLLLSSCTSRSGSAFDPDLENTPIDAYTRYASGFRVSDQGSYTVIEVTDPWQQSKNVIFSYVLAPNQEALPDSLKNRPFIKTPVERVIALSTTHVAMIDQLGSAESIVGLSGSEFIYSPPIRGRIESGSITDVGYGQGLDFETIVRLEPDVLFLYGVEGNVMTTLEKLTDLGISAVFCGEYLETHPLGKAEWIRFFSLFYNKEEQSTSFFQHIDSAYSALSALASGVLPKPVVLNGLPWKDTWFMAGGKSFAAKLIEDAGGDYLWSDSPSTQAVPLDLESVYLRAINADIWINPGAAGSLADILLLDERLGDLEVLKNGHVFNNDARSSLAGGNDYWESGTVRPDLVLADLIEVFHPDLLTDHSFVYYRQLK